MVATFTHGAASGQLDARRLRVFQPAYANTYYGSYWLLALALFRCKSDCDFQGEWSLLRALHMENAVNRNKVMHTHEVVAQLTRWWDDEVFEKYPSWEECERAGFFTSPLLEAYFGKENEVEDHVPLGRPLRPPDR